MICRWIAFNCNANQADNSLEETRETIQWIMSLTSMIIVER